MNRITETLFRIVFPLIFATFSSYLHGSSLESLPDNPKNSDSHSSYQTTPNIENIKNEVNKLLQQCQTSSSQFSSTIVQFDTSFHRYLTTLSPVEKPYAIEVFKDLVDNAIASHFSESPSKCMQLDYQYISYLMASRFFALDIELAYLSPETIARELNENVQLDKAQRRSIIERYYDSSYGPRENSIGAYEAIKTSRRTADQLIAITKPQFSQEIEDVFNSEFDSLLSHIKGRIWCIKEIPSPEIKKIFARNKIRVVDPRAQVADKAKATLAYLKEMRDPSSNFLDTLLKLEGDFQAYRRELPQDQHQIADRAYVNFISRELNSELERKESITVADLFTFIAGYNLWDRDDRIFIIDSYCKKFFADHGRHPVEQTIEHLTSLNYLRSLLPPSLHQRAEALFYRHIDTMLRPHRGKTLTWHGKLSQATIKFFVDRGITVKDPVTLEKENIKKEIYRNLDSVRNTSSLSYDLLKRFNNKYFNLLPTLPSKQYLFANQCAFDFMISEVQKYEKAAGESTLDFSYKPLPILAFGALTRATKIELINLSAEAVAAVINWDGWGSKNSSVRVIAFLYFKDKIRELNNDIVLENFKYLGEKHQKIKALVKDDLKEYIDQALYSHLDKMMSKIGGKRISNKEKLPDYVYTLARRYGCHITTPEEYRAEQEAKEAAARRERRIREREAFERRWAAREASSSSYDSCNNAYFARQVANAFWDQGGNHWTSDRYRPNY